MARQLTGGELQLYGWLLSAAEVHVERRLGTNVDVGVDELVGGLRPEQRAAMEALMRGTSVDTYGEPRYGRRVGPIRPSRARALRSGLEAVLAGETAGAAPPPSGEVTPADAYLDIGLRRAFAQDQLDPFTQQSGIRQSWMFSAVRSRDPEAAVFATAARKLVNDVADRAGMAPRDVRRHLLRTPQDQRFDEAAKMMGRRATNGLAPGHRAYALGSMANAMRGQFAQLGRVDARYANIGRRNSFGFPRRVRPRRRGVFRMIGRGIRWTIGLGVLATLATINPLLLVPFAGRLFRVVQRSQRSFHRLAAWRNARSAGRAADSTLRRELRSPPVPMQVPAQQQLGPPAWQQRPAPGYTQQRQVPANLQQGPAPVYAQQAQQAVFAQQGQPPGFAQQGRPPGFAPQQPAPAYPPQQPAPAYAQQGPPAYAPQQVQQGPPAVFGPQVPPGFAPQQGQPVMGGGADDTVRLTPGWAAATTGTTPLQGVTGDATAPQARPAHHERGTQHESKGRNG